MAKTKISEFSATPANNTDIDSINIAEGCAPSGINDAIRELMAQLKDFQTGAVGDSFNGPIGATTASTGAFTTLSASGTATLSGLTASTALALDASKNVVSVTNTGTGNNVLATSPTLVTPILGTPTSATLTNATGLPISTGVSGLGTGVATALAVNVGSAGAPVVNGGALGTPSSGTVTNLTGTASININGTVGSTTPTTGAFTTVAASSDVTLSGGTANGVTYLNGSKVLTSGSALTFDGTNLTAVGSLVAQRTGGVSQYARISNTGGTATFISDNQASSAYTGFVFQGLSTASGTPVDYLNLTSTSLYTASGINVGIGTSSPSQKLEVSGTILAKTTSTPAIIARSTSTGMKVFYDDGRTEFTAVNYDGISTVGAQDLFITSGQKATFGVNSNSSIIYPLEITTAGVLSIPYGQIKFPATQSASSDANTLDDYEEGTWTPVLGGTGGTSGQTYSYRVGRYTKIGRQVICSFEAALSAVGTVTDYASISGLPFTSTGTSTNLDAGGFLVTFASGLATNQIYVTGYIFNGITEVWITGTSSAGTVIGNILATNIWGNSARISGTITYTAS